MLTEAGCRGRQRRLLGKMAALDLDLVLVSDPRHVYYFSGVWESGPDPIVGLFWAEGQTALVTALSPGAAFVDALYRYETYSIDRVLEYVGAEAGPALGSALAASKAKVRRAGIEAAVLPVRLAEELERRHPEAVRAELLPALYELFETKDEDEVALLREDIALTERAYRVAQETIRPGLTELDVYSAMYAALVESAGTTLPFPGDFACGLRAIGGGGPPTRRVLQEGDLYILDLFPVWQGYQSDMCRTFAVGAVSAVQQRAWELVQGALELAEACVRPGLEARELYQQVRAHLDQWELVRGTFFHHAGHGIGMHGHERPRIHGGSDHRFQAGQVFTFEPGVYAPELQGGIRLEQNYWLTANGLQRLTSYPLALRS